MKGFNLLERSKLVIAFKKCNIYQLEEIRELVNSEIERRKKKESKVLKKWEEIAVNIIKLKQAVI